MKLNNNKRMVNVVFLLLAAAIMKYGLTDFLSIENNFWINLLEIGLILIIGGGFVLKGAANIIEETTEVLSEKTKIASGVLQSIGTAFPDMALGVVAAVVSLNLVKSNYAESINYAIIAAATTFGSNIYNIGHAAWCIYRQNLANTLNKTILMFPFFKKLGEVKPIDTHKIKPTLKEFDVANDILNTLTVLTAIVAGSMVIFGKVTIVPETFTGDLYQLIRPVGIVIFLICGGLMYLFRKTHRPKNPIEEIQQEEKYFKHQKMWVIWLSLIISGLAILLAAESMVHAIKVLSEITGVSTVITGVLAGIIGCLGEMIVVHNFTVNPEGRIGDAVVGVAMDNIVTTMGAAIVAMMGGIFLGGNALILIFVLILTLNSTLIWQISKLKNYYLR